MLRINFNITFEPGNYYWILTSEELESLQEWAEEFEFTDFSSDFEKGSDGRYYAIDSVISEDEADFLNEWNLGEHELYTKSTQSTNWF